MANQYTAKVNVNVRGTNLIIDKLRSSKGDIEQAQYRAGQELGTYFVGEAYRVIRTLSPKSKGALAASITFNTVRQMGGWRTKVYSDLPYAEVVESGGPAEMKKVSSDLKDWYKRVTGKDVKLGSYVTVRKGNNPNYDTRVGMQYFQKPFRKNAYRIPQMYEKRVREALSKVGVEYY